MSGLWWRGWHVRRVRQFWPGWWKLTPIVARLEHEVGVVTEWEVGLLGFVLRGTRHYDGRRVM